MRLVTKMDGWEQDEKMGNGNRVKSYVGVILSEAFFFNHVLSTNIKQKKQKTNQNKVREQNIILNK